MEVESFFKGRKILVTGHTGFIGSWLTKWLTMLSADVCGYALEPHTHPNMYDILDLDKFLIYVKGDIRNAELLHKTLAEFQPEIVIHLAAQPIVLESYDNPVDTFDVNVTGTVNLLNEVRKVGSVKVIIVMTSDKSYRNNEWVYPYRENDVLGGKDPYSASKSCQDIVVNSFSESYFYHSGIAIASIRAGNVIGGGDWAPFRIIPDLVRGIAKGETVKIRNPNSVRPWQHVLEPITGMLMLAERMYKNVEFSGNWNFGPESHKEITVKELAETFIGFWGSGNYSIEEMKSYNEADYLQLDISKAKRMLKWTPQYNFNTALKETVDWYKRYYGAEINMKKKTEEQIEKYFSNFEA
jgi:CDP-glucose 4,6-dehydratase